MLLPGEGSQDGDRIKRISKRIADAFASDFLFNHSVCKPTSSRMPRTEVMEPRTRSTSTSMAGVEWMSPQEGLEVLQRHPVLAVGDSVTRQLVHSAWSYVSADHGSGKGCPRGGRYNSNCIRQVCGWVE